MTGVLASVQTTADAAPLTWAQVLIAVAAVALFCAALAAPALIEAWRRANHVIDHMPLKPKSASHPAERTL